ncbi:MAG: TlpA disulfide reductase family protein [Bacteroidetes bacterium]|nr:TlpA disulfide reductase family protein [Bacteroidota bacterium]MDA0874089.1 TlpA disulfide reductase family protein [Bacteroidota bacterium]
MTSLPKEPATAKPRAGWKRMALEWGGILLFLAFLRFTDPGTVVLGKMQQALLATGLFQAETAWAEEEAEPASYDLALISLDRPNRSVHLSAFEGKTIFLNLWATWCAPCLAEMPYIQRLYETMKEEVVFVTIATDDDEEVARRFIEARGYTFPVYRVAGPMPELYRSPTLPTTWVISPGGKLATVHAGMANYDTKGFRRFLRSLSDAQEL